MNRARHIDIVGIGASTLDRFIVVDHFPTGREVQQVISSTADGGGPVATALATASRYGAKTIMIDSVGDDMVGHHIIEDFHRYGVQTEAINIETGATSGVATILVKESTGERAVFFEKSTTSEPHMTDNYKKSIEDSCILHINGRHRTLMCQAMEIAKSSGRIISLDGGAQRYDEAMGQITKDCHVVIVARDYAEKYTGTTDLEKAVRIIHERGAIIAGITDGANGSHFVWPDGTYYRCAAYSQEHIVDTTGCGDSFHGAFVGELAKIIESAALPVQALQTMSSDTLAYCARFASAVASHNTQHIGGRSGLPTKEQVIELMETTV